MTASGARRLLHHRTVSFVAVIGLLWGAWTASQWLSAPGRIDPALERALHQDAPVNVTIMLGFAPEDFHIRLLQTYGVVSGVQQTTVLMNRVRGENVYRIARHYWVRRITLR